MKTRNYMFLFAALAAVMMSDLFLSGKTYLPADILYQNLLRPDEAYGEPSIRNLLIADPILIFYPQDTFYNENLKKLKIPLWDPHSFCGHPLLASGQSALLYPPRMLLHFLFSPSLAHDLTLFIHLMMMGAGMFLLLRELRLGETASAFGAVVWMFNGFAMTWFEFEHAVMLCANLTLSIFFFEKWLKSGSVPGLMASGFFIGMCLLGRHLQLDLYAIPALITYAIARAAGEYSSGRLKALSAVAGSLLAVIIGIGIAAPQLIPTLELVAGSVSQRPEAQGFTMLPLSILYTLFAPRLLGSTVDQVDLIPALNINEFAGCIGVLPFVAAIAACFTSRMRTTVLVMLGFSVFFLLIALGTPVYYPFFHIMPGLKRVAFSRFIFLYAFFMTMLSAFGLETMLTAGVETSAKIRKYSLVTIAAVAILCATVLFSNLASLPAGWISLSNPPVLFFALELSFAGLFFAFLSPEGRPRYLGLSAIVFSGAFLILFGKFYNPAVDRDLLFPKRDYFETARWAPGARVAGIYPNIFEPYGLESIDGYDSIYPDRYSELLKAFGFASYQKSFADRYERNLFSLLNVRYAYSSAVTRDSGGDFKAIYDRETTVWMNQRALPRAFAVHAYRLAGSAVEVAGILKSPGFDPGAEAILERRPGAVAGATGSSRVGIVRLEPSGAVLDAEMKANGLVVLTNTFYPGWVAEVDGRPEEIIPAYHAFMAVEVPTGRHEVKFAFKPGTFIAGIILFFIIAIPALAAAVMLRGRR
jgi:hypothetical protein